MQFLETLGVNWIQLIGFFVNFLILLFILNKFVFKKAISNMEQRQKLAEDLLRNSRSTQIALEDAKREFEEVVAKANAEAQQIVGKADESAKHVAEQIKQKAEEQAEIILQKAQAEIKESQATTRKELEKQIGVLVVDTVEKVIGDLPADQKKKIMEKVDSRFVS